MSRNRFAVCVHVYYEEMWPDIGRYLKFIDIPFDLYVTCRPEIYVNILKSVLAKFPFAEVIACENIGMDVVPFLMLAHKRNLSAYTAVLKLHTKNMKTPERTEQGRIMFEGLCGNAALCKDIVDAFERDPNIGIVGPAMMLRSADALMYGNRKTVDWLLSSMNIGAQHWDFFAGTMFWIAGRALAPIAAIYPEILEASRRGRVVGTGGDGTIAHSLERIFGALVASTGMNIYVTERLGVARDRFAVMPAQQHGPSRDRRCRESDSLSLIRRSQEAANWHPLIRKSGLFDEAFYQKSIAGRYEINGMDSLFHFIIYGDLLYLDPSPAFSVTYYMMTNRDVLVRRANSVAHYLLFGRKEGRIAEPSRSDWLDLATKMRIFDPEYYSNRYKECQTLNMDPGEHYLSVGYKFSRATSQNFNPGMIPDLARNATVEDNAVINYMKHHMTQEYHFYDVMDRACANGDYKIVLTLASEIRERFGETRALLEAVATAKTVYHNWDEAEKAWGSYWSRFETGTFVERGMRTVVNYDKKTSSNNKKFSVKIIEKNKAIEPPRKKVVIYTTLFGDRDHLLPVVTPSSDIDYVCFSDREWDVPGWTVRVVDPGFQDNNLNAKIYKILPHRFLGEYDASLFVDANTLIYGRIHQLLRYCDAAGPFVMWQHPFREDVYLEAAAIIGFGRHSPDKILSQIKNYASEGMPRDVGLAEGSFIWRRHDDSRVCGFMEQWWDEISRFSKRDQLSLGFLMWKTGIRPTIFPDQLGTSRKNNFFVKIPHKDKKIKSPKVLAGENARTLNVRRTPGLAFLYSTKFMHSGSTVMRGLQLSEMIRLASGGEANVIYTDETVLRNKIVILTKGFLKTTTPEELRKLGMSNILVADFVDEPPVDSLVAEVDGMMAASLTALSGYLHLYPDKRIFNVTHHVDTRIDFHSNRHSLSPRMGYFGERVNTIESRDIARHVDFVQVDTSVQSLAWMDKLAHYDFHYAVRRRRGIDGAKPFLKGFTAAHCGANMLIQRNEGDARFYLGHDYPYLLEDNCTEADILDAIRRVQEGYGGREWRYGLDIMKEVKHRSSRDFIVKEMENMIRSLVRDH